jgi:hypothetical protein
MNKWVTLISIEFIENTPVMGCFLVLLLLVLAWKWRIRDLIKGLLILTAIPVLHVHFLNKAEKFTGLSGPDIACTAPIGRLWRLSRCKVGLGDKILIQNDSSGVIRTEFYCFKKIQVYKF